MASLNMAPEELKQLELLRSRFSQLTRSIQSLRQSVLNSNPLPSRSVNPVLLPAHLPKRRCIR
jgi:mediator of RNA polymerase II transcription subunit 8